MTDLGDFTGLVAREHGLSVVSVARADGSIASSVVNAGVLAHPVTGDPVIGFTTRRGAAKLGRLRAAPRASLTVRVGWEWATAEGPAELAGPDDPMAGIDAERLRVLLREVFTAAGGTHDDWAAYDAVMAREGRAAVLVAPERVYSNPAG
jgi:PPOX class probable F420-dependent enzyme